MQTNPSRTHTLFYENRLGKQFLKVKRRDPNKLMEIYARRESIPSILIGQKVGVHNGRTMKYKVVNALMLGHKLGEFAHTRLKHTFKVKHK